MGKMISNGWHLIWSRQFSMSCGTSDRRKWISFLFLIGFLLCVSSTAQARGWAVLVGIDRYSNPQVSPLVGAVNDAKSLSKVVKNVFKLPNDNVLLFVSDATDFNSLPNTGSIVRALQYVARKAKKDDLFIFAFSGHGVGRGDNGYLFTYATDPNAVSYTGFSLEQINDLVGRIPALKKLLIIDACRNDPESGKGEGDNLLTETFTRSIVRKSSFNSGSRAATKAVLFSCEVGERAFEWPGRQRGIFSLFLENGLKGEAADHNGRVTLGSLVDYLGRKVPAKVQLVRGPEKKQHPFVSMEGGNPANWILVDPPKAQSATLTIESNVTGADVYVGLQHVGTTPLKKMEISPGVSRIRVIKKGFISYNEPIEFKAGHHQPLTIQLPEEQSNAGRLFVTTDPFDATVKILKFGRKYYPGIELDPGEYEVEVSAKGHRSVKRTLRISPRENKRETFILIVQGKESNTGTWQNMAEIEKELQGYSQVVDFGEIRSENEGIVKKIRLAPVFGNNHQIYLASAEFGKEVKLGKLSADAVTLFYCESIKGGSYQYPDVKIVLTLPPDHNLINSTYYGKIKLEDSISKKSVLCGFKFRLAM